MMTLVVGASGATGRLLVQHLLRDGQPVRVIVRSAGAFREVVGDVARHERLSITEASLLDLSSSDLVEHVRGCDAVASCLGHNLSMKGLFGPPYRLVTEATRRLCHAIRAAGPERPVRFVLMNTAGNRNRGLDEPVSFAERGIVGLLRLLLPPHADNEQAAELLRVEIGPHDPEIEWAVVRPDDLIDRSEVSGYELHASPIRSAIFDAGKTSRTNVAHFMARLITEDDPWRDWKGQMPVIYDAHP